MSQSDYIKHIKLAEELKTQSRFRPVLNSRDYTLYKEFVVMNNVKNSVNLYNELAMSGITNIFDMPLANVNECSNFIIGQDTNTRSYRVPMSKVYFDPQIILPYKKHRLMNKRYTCCYDNSNIFTKHKCNCVKF